MYAIRRTCPRHTITFVRSVYALSKSIPCQIDRHRFVVLCIDSHWFTTLPLWWKLWFLTSSYRICRSKFEDESSTVRHLLFFRVLGVRPCVYLVRAADPDMSRVLYPYEGIRIRIIHTWFRVSIPYGIVIPHEVDMDRHCQASRYVSGWMFISG
jgi:hypothetical protein